MNNVCSKPVRRISFELYVKVGAHTRDQSIFIAWVEEYRRILENHVPKEYKTRNRNEGGSGLGLAIVKHIVEAHNELVYVESSLNVGSEFSFTLTKSN